eukprot:1832070-Pleurochrysis_carterae.AAC.1
MGSIRRSRCNPTAASFSAVNGGVWVTASRRHRSKGDNRSRLQLRRDNEARGSAKTGITLAMCAQQHEALHHRYRAYAFQKQRRGPRVSEGLPPPMLSSRAAFWLSGPRAKRRSAKLLAAAPAIPAVRMAKLFGSA